VAKLRITETERAAYHEAGHVVVQYLLGMETKRVSIVTDEVSLGRTEFTWPRGLDQVEGPPRVWSGC
jgi:ATP-dependent Zn protease